MKYSSPSDYTSINPSYSNGRGYYTDVTKVENLLQIPVLSGSTNPSIGDVGEFIQRIEDYIDTRTGTSFRSITYVNEYHEFDFRGGVYPRYWSDYVGFVQLQQAYIQKLLRLEVWQGSSWRNLASATALITVDSSNTGVNSTVVLGLPNGTSITLDEGTTAAQFNNTFGPKTTAQEIVYLINETFPTNTASVTGAIAAKSDSESPSKYFYATVDTEDERKVIISSLLPSDDGSACTIAVTGTGLTASGFTDDEEMARLGQHWKIGDEGRIFFRTTFPYLRQNSIRVTYIAGKPRVPGMISDAATKLVACEILRHDDQTVLISETGAQIDTKGKYDVLKAEADVLLNLGQETVYFIG
tara:strand:+ start:4010 stop:5077 length:1068 start_codon:yes stop_codon:yes gene_type:complete